MEQGSFTVGSTYYNILKSVTMEDQSRTLNMFRNKN